MNQVNWNHVYYFSEIARAGSLKAAADRLGLSSSTLSEHLSQLEHDLDVKLFQRQHRKLALTQEGARLFHCAKEMFETGRRFIDMISPASLGRYPISIGIVPTASYALAYQIVTAYVAGYKGASVTVLRCSHDELEAGILEGRVAFGFTDRKTDRRNVAQSPVVASEIKFLVSETLAHLDLRELLAERPLLLCRTDRAAPSAVEEILSTLDIVPSSLVVSEFPSLIETMCREGVGVAALGRMHLVDDPAVRAVRLPHDFPSLTQRLYATWATDAESGEAVRHLQRTLPPFAR